jgi:CRISPR-associated protein Cas2
MYIILVYDVEEKRVGKMLKLCRRYLNWIQNSVFEGEITDVKLKELLSEAKKKMDIGKDSLILFKSRDEKWLEKEVIGKEKNELNNML